MTIARDGRQDSIRCRPEPRELREKRAHGQAEAWCRHLPRGRRSEGRARDDACSPERTKQRRGHADQGRLVATEGVARWIDEKAALQAHVVSERKEAGEAC